MRFILNQKEVDLAVSDHFSSNYNKLKGDVSLEQQLESLNLDGVKLDISEQLLPLFVALVEDDCIDEIVSYEQYLQLKAATLQVFNSQAAAEKMDALHDKVCEKFPILVLVDLGGTIFCRSDDKKFRDLKYDRKLAKYCYFYRPGHK